MTLLETVIGVAAGVFFGCLALVCVALALGVRAVDWIKRKWADALAWAESYDE